VIRVPGGPLAPARTRRALESRVAHAVDAQVGYNLMLLANEVVTNAVAHGNADESRDIELGLSIEPGRVTVDVADNGPGFTPTPRRAGLEEPGGWGLVLVEHLASRWGVRPGKPSRVWFQFDI
jgi:two-component sensor histidine kinase